MATSFSGAVMLLKPFTGDPGSQKITKFIRSVSAVGRLANLSDADLFEAAKLKLDGTAADFVDSSPDLNTWADLRTALLDRFDPKLTPTVSRARLLARFQEPTESAQEFLQGLRLLGRHALKLTEDEFENQIRREILEEAILSQFVTGLKPEIRRFVFTSNPATIEAALAAANREEAFLAANALPAAPPAVRRVADPVPVPRPRRE